jgi:hypothetical protein
VTLARRYDPYGNSLSSVGSGASVFGFAGEQTDATNVINWTSTSATSVTRTGLNLVTGRQYFFSVQARNAGGLWSAVTSRSFVAGVPCNRVYLPLVVR